MLKIYKKKKKLRFPIKNTCPGQATLGPPRVMVPSASMAGFDLPDQALKGDPTGRAGPGSSELSTRLGAGGRSLCFPRLFLQQCGSSVAQLGRSKQRGRKELTKVCASWRKWKGHRAEEKVPASPERSRAPSTAYSPLLLLAHLSRKAQRQEVDSPGPSSALTDSSTVLHCWHQGHRNQFFCLLPSRLIFPQLHDASCGDGWMTAVSGPYHHRECENAVRHQRSCSVSALCAGSSTLRRKKVHLCAGHASVSWTPEPGP